MSETNDQAPQPYISSGNYEYSCQGNNPAQVLQIFSSTQMRSTYHTAQEALDLLRFLQSHQQGIEAAARQQAEEAKKPKPNKSVKERLNDLLS